MSQFCVLVLDFVYINGINLVRFIKTWQSGIGWYNLFILSVSYLRLSAAILRPGYMVLFVHNNDQANVL